MRLFSLLALAVLAHATTVTVSSPLPNDPVGKIWQATGTATPTSGSITTMTFAVDGGVCPAGYTGCSGPVQSPGPRWTAAIYFIEGSIPSGAHMLVISATDSAGNVGSSAPVPINVVYSAPICSMTTIQGSAFTCVTTARGGTSSANSVSITFPNGYQAGDLIIIDAGAQVPASPNTILSAAIASTTQTPISYFPPAVAFPPYPFALDLYDDIYGANYERVTMTGPGVMVRGPNPTLHANNSSAGFYSPGTYPLAASMMTNTLGFKWSLAQTNNSGFTDKNIVQGGIFFAQALTTTTDPDTITFSYPAAITNGNGIMLVTALVYRGLGQISGMSSPLPGWAGADGEFPANAAMAASGAGSGGYANSWIGVTPGDLCIVFAGGSPFMPVNSGSILVPASPPVEPSAPNAWVERVEDQSRPFLMIIDAVATSDHCNGGALVTPGDGVGALGVAFHPASAVVITPPAPVVSAVTSTNTITITWATNELSTSQVSYGTTAAYGLQSPLDSVLTMTHSVTLTGLIAGTTYDYAVASTNAAGASTVSPDSTFLIPSAIPINPPPPQTNYGTMFWTAVPAGSALPSCNSYPMPIIPVLPYQFAVLQGTATPTAPGTGDTLYVALVGTQGTCEWVKLASAP